MLSKINGYKKFTVALLTLIVLTLKTFFGKNLDIDVNATADAVIALVSVGYMISQAVHDIFLEKAKLHMQLGK